MADNDTARRTNREKAEGDRDTAIEGAGITNRPDEQEAENQERVPPRGARNDEERAKEDRKRTVKDPADGSTLNTKM